MRPVRRGTCARASWIMLAVLGLQLAAPATAAEHLVEGAKLVAKTRRESGVPTKLRLVLKDPSIGAPFPDPRSGAVVRLDGGNDEGQCNVHVVLDPSGWTEQRGDGAAFGYRYRAASPGTQGIRRVTLRPGRIVVRGRGAALPCSLAAAAQREPLRAELRLGAERYCAAFGGTVKTNEPGRFVARRAASPAACEPPRLNVVVLLADDLGYRDIGVHGSPVIPTPNIDALAAAGARFTNAYVTGGTCSPSRAALLTGRYQQRVGFEFNTGGRQLTHDEGRGLDVSATTIADVLSASGYATGMVGKWHLGTQDRFHPFERGFGEFFGFLIGAHPYFPATVADREPWETILRGTERANETAYLTDAFAREAVAFVDRHQADPFFLYVPFNAVHTPLEATDEYLARFPDVADPDLRAYYAMTSALDDAVGAILAALDRNGLADRTLVVFTNDNGGTIAIGDNAPLRLGKTTLFEGGVRVPLVVRWPGVTTAATVRDEMVSLLDLFPTILAATDTPVPSDITLDGVELGPTLRGERTDPVHERLFWRSGPNKAVRQGNWKLVQAGEHVWLFDLAADVGETTNLATGHPDVVAELLGALAAWEAELAPPAWPSRFERTILVDGVPYDIHV